MNGQMTKSERQKIVSDFIKRCDPYAKTQTTYKFDMRGYADYLKKNQIDVENVPPDVVNMFKDTAI